MISPQHLIAYCQANAAIAAAVGTVTVGGYTGIPIAKTITTAFAGLMPRKVILITASGAPEIVGPNDLARSRMDVRCYGFNEDEAWALNGAVYAELRYNRPLTINGKHVTQLSPSGGGTQDYDSDGDWPFVFVEYTLVISEGRS